MNKLTVILAFLLITLFSCPSFSAEISKKEEEFVEKIGNTVELLANHPNASKVWKTFDLSNTPLIVTFGSKNIYAFGLKNPSPAWQQKQVGKTLVSYSEIDHWGVTKVSMQAEFQVDGESVFVFNIDESEGRGLTERPVLVLVHELFHHYQFQHFKEPTEFGHYVDQMNMQNLALINIEERILIDFLRVKDEYKLEMLKNFMAVNSARKQITDPKSIKWEQFQQVMEGLADYTSIQTFNTFPIISDFDAHKHLQYVLAGYVYSDDPQELAVKWRHYGVGATLGIALDYLKVSDWKDKIESENESQISLLEQELKLSDMEVENRLNIVNQNYHYDEIEQNLEAKVLGFKSMISRLMDDYHNQKGLIVTIQKPLDASVNGGGSSHGIFHLEDGLTVSVKDKSVSASTDNLWKMELKEIPFIFQDSSCSRILKVDEQLQIVIDGTSHTLESLKELDTPIYFKSISWDDHTSTFQSNDREGRLLYTDDGFFINFKAS